jgi:nitrogen-specific signal transduction histidine kinase
MTISDAQHRLLLDNLTTATLLLNSELRLEYMNPAAEMLLAVSGQRSHGDRKSTRLNSSHNPASRMPSSA